VTLMTVLRDVALLGASFALLRLASGARSSMPEPG
jgi:hypothetical protein